MSLPMWKAKESNHTPYLSRSHRVLTRQILRVLLALAVVILVYRWKFSSRVTVDDSQVLAIPIEELRPERPVIRHERKALVVASLDDEDTTWLDDHLSDWEHFVYVVNSPQARLTVPRNKGRESTAYLTFLIDNYDDLPDYMLFLHSLRYQWHNEDPMYDGVPMIKNLQLPYVKAEGFTNVRCTWTMGCPNEIRPKLDHVEVSDAEYSRVRVEAAFAEAFKVLLPGRPVPEEVGASCGAQFALSREKVLERPREDYKFYRNWLLNTDLDDSVSGRILEYSWHMIFGKPAIHCPDAGLCFCQKYGLCNLTCTESGCEKRYQLPMFATFPPGWPENGPGTDGWPEKGWDQ